MIIEETNVRVRYSETDQMGVVHHATYLLYFELARTETLRKLGIVYKKLEEQGVMLPVISAQVNYLRPAFYDDELTIKTYLKEKPKVKVNFEYEIYCNNNMLCNGIVTLAFMDSKTRKPVKPPQEFSEIINPYF